jgi:hypothetical protein
MPVTNHGNIIDLHATRTVASKQHSISQMLIEAEALVLLQAELLRNIAATSDSPGDCRVLIIANSVERLRNHLTSMRRMLPD